MDPFSLIAIIVFIALVFDFFNGFNDAANSIATIVATRVLSPGQAVFWAAFFNFIAAFGFGTAVAKTVGSGMVNGEVVTGYVVIGGLTGAIFWTWLASHYGLPISGSHSLVGGYAGAAMARVGVTEGWSNVLNGIEPDGWILTIFFIFCAPLMGLVIGVLLMVATSWTFRRARPQIMDHYFRRLQLLSSAVYSFAHGTNDAQKTMGVIASALFAGGYIKEFYIPYWVILVAHAAIALGTFLGGWRVIRTMGHRITRLRPMGGFCAESSGGLSLLFAASLGIPASTTHTIAGAIAGVGTTQRLRAVRWRTAREILLAWILTIPTAVAVSGLAYLTIHFLVPGAQ